MTNGLRHRRLGGPGARRNGTWKPGLRTRDDHLARVGRPLLPRHRHGVGRTCSASPDYAVSVTWGHDHDSIPRWTTSSQCPAGVARSGQPLHGRLVRLKELAVYYDRPDYPCRPRLVVSSAFLRAHLYGCMQTLFKFHPEFDALLAGIPPRSGRPGPIIEGHHPNWTPFATPAVPSNMPDVVDRIRFMPAQQHSSFVCLTAACDVMLDPIHSAGVTRPRGLAFRVPVVTLPSPSYGPGLPPCISRWG